MSVKCSVNGEVVTAMISGEIDHHTAKAMRTEIDAAVEINMPSLLVLDFYNVTFMDSSGIGLVLGRYKNLSKRGGQVELCGMRPNIYKVMKLSGIERIIKIEEPKKRSESNAHKK